MKHYEVKSINPHNGLECIYHQIPESRIYTVDGKQVYYYSKKFPTCPIESIKVSQMSYNVKIIHPTTGRPCTFIDISEDRLPIVNGEQVFAYDHNYTACKIISIEQVPQAYLDAQLAYFAKFGTACE